MNGFFSTLIHPEESDLSPSEFLIPIACVMFMCMVFVIMIMPLAEAILSIIVVVGSTMIGLGMFMTKFSHEYLKKISLRGFGFILLAILAYFIYQSDNMLPTGELIVNILLLVISSIAAIILFIYAVMDLVFAVTFSIKRKQNAKWGDSEGKLHIDSRYIYFRSDDGKKRVAIRCSDIVDVESDSKHVIVYFTADSKVSSERFDMSNTDQMCKDIKKMLGI